MVLDPHLIPGYEILDRLASGGVAEVFRAVRVSDGSEVALKVTSLADLDPDYHAAERFRREGELLARLEHPALPRVLGAGVTDRELGWIALELVRGRPLGTWAMRPAAELIPVFIQIAEGLQAVAQEGIVHRDVSPDNILVEEQRGRPRARLIDFGIAKDLIGGGELTQHGAFLGKLQYAPPEQLLGLPRGEAIDFRSDIYALGLTMYEVLSGRRAVPYESLPEIVDAHRTGSIPPLELPEGHPPAIRLVILVTRMIAPRREDRPPSWEAVLAELWRAREEVSPLAETLARKGARPSPDATPLTLPPDSAARLKREVLFGRAVLGAGVAALLAALVFTGLLLKRRPASPSPGEPVPSPALPARDPRAVSAPSPTPRRPARVAPTHVPTVPPPRPTATPEPTTGILEVVLLPAGELDEMRDERGRLVPAPRTLPARLALSPGRYALKLVSRGLDCVKSVPVVVKAGKTTTVRESCIEVK